MLGRAFLFGLFYQALVIATVHRLKQAKTKNHQFSFGFYLDGQAAPCPFRPSSVLKTCRSAKPPFYKFSCHKAAGGDLTHPADAVEILAIWRYGRLPVKMEGVDATRGYAVNLSAA
jgi:hypothetical protein